MPVRSVASNSLQFHGLWPTGLLCPWLFPEKNTERVVIPSSRGLPTPGVEPVSPASPALAGGFFTLSLSHSQSSFLVKLLASTKWSTLCWVPWKPKPWSWASFPGVCHYVPCDVGCATHFCGCALGWVQRPGLCDLSPFSALHSWMQ